MNRSNKNTGKPDDDQPQSARRFANRAANYVKYRPHYPKTVISWIKETIGLAQTALIADIGCGTGISSELFLEFGCKVVGIEPSDEMREAANEVYRRFIETGHYQTVKGTAENLPFEAHSVDVVLAGQSFHWFDAPKFHKEVKRVLKPEGWLIMMWNSRQRSGTPLLDAYEDLLLTHGTDYQAVHHMKNGDEEVRLVFSSYQRKEFDNFKKESLAEAKGRMFSSSYTPAPADPASKRMLAYLKEIFAQTNEAGYVDFRYLTEVYIGKP